MHAGPFNQSAWLHSAFRWDIVDEYEAKCKTIVNSFEGESSTDEVVRELLQKLSAELIALGERALKMSHDNKRWEDSK